jgi:hypothetical protein
VVAAMDLADGVDAVEFLRNRPSAARENRFDWSFSFLGLSHGFHTLSVVAYEASGRGGLTEFEFFVDTCPADVNMDGVASPADFNAWILAFNGNDPRADQNGDGLVTPADFNAWIANFNAGCN